MDIKAITRDGLITLRENMIKYDIEPKQIDRITNILIRWQDLSHLEYPWRTGGRVRSEVINTGHGAFGEPDNDYADYTTTAEGTKLRVFEDVLILISNKDKVLGTILLCLDKIKKKIKEKIQKEADQLKKCMDI
jgi:hypothetical protein